MLPWYSEPHDSRPLPSQHARVQTWRLDRFSPSAAEKAARRFVFASSFCPSRRPKRYFVRAPVVSVGVLRVSRPPHLAGGETAATSSGRGSGTASGQSSLVQMWVTLLGLWALISPQIATGELSCHPQLRHCMRYRCLGYRAVATRELPRGCHLWNRSVPPSPREREGGTEGSSASSFFLQSHAT